MKNKTTQTNTVISTENDRNQSTIDNSKPVVRWYTEYKKRIRVFKSKNNTVINKQKKKKLKSKKTKIRKNFGSR
jgi:hypothetical protein